MNTTLADLVEKELEPTQAALGSLPNLLAHLQRQREEMHRAALELTCPLASTVSVGEPSHERTELNHRRS